MQTAGSTSETTIPARGGDPRTTLVLARYRLIRRLGAGAFGVVWLAHDERLDRVVAVKRIELHDEHIAARAEREGFAAARLSHPGIVALYEAGSDEDAVFLVSELVRGRTLDELTDTGALSDRDVLRIGAALCDALEHAHARGVIHRDVKPANVIVPDHPAGEAGIAKLTDFGVARIGGDAGLTRTGDVVGTLAYMAPEQADGREVGGEADLYALGLVLYEALSGVNPIRAPGAAATARRVGAHLPPLGRLRRDVPAVVAEAIDRAVEPAPLDRGTLEDLRDALDEALDDVSGVAGVVVGPTVPIDDPELPLEPGRRTPRRGMPAAGAVPALPPHEVAPRRRPAGPAARVLAAAGAAALVGTAFAVLGVGATPEPGAMLALVAGTAAAVLLLPRAGWLVAAAALIAWLVAVDLPGVAVLLAAGVLPTVLLLPRDGPLWSAPPLAIVLGLAGCAMAWPAVAGQAPGLLRRAALGALGLWWIALAEAVAVPALVLGDVDGTPSRTTWESSAQTAATDVLGPLLGHGVPLLALAWAAAAAVLPLIVRGRSLPLDLVAVTAWGGALAAGTAALAASLPWDGGTPSVRGLVIGTALGASLALLAAAGRSGITRE